MTSWNRSSIAPFRQPLSTFAFTEAVKEVFGHCSLAYLSAQQMSALIIFIPWNTFLLEEKLRHFQWNHD